MKTQLPGEALFKPVEGGYLFESPSPWIFVPGRRYVVTADQKQAILALMPQRGPRRIVAISLAIVLYACAISLLWSFLSPRSRPGPIDVLGMAVTILVPLYAAGVVALRQFLGRIAPIVSTAVPTDARMTFGERYLAVGDAMSTKVLVVSLLLWSASAVISLVAVLAGGHGQLPTGEATLYLPMLQICLSTALAVSSAAMLIRRIRRGR